MFQAAMKVPARGTTATIYEAVATEREIVESLSPHSDCDEVHLRRGDHRRGSCLMDIAT
ncbi:hypothetical protein GcM1_223050 [Golovinomyces cichoracearum]|uniref:Uncharacterized protein n=1 Tax=Golovinomyces cichoracearum TaxID=62708 RepID=A0A420IR42_9PEZI|nr:hypothetical protein GcM1_223050 [Golovinomyces cichoracearum]